VSLLISPSRLLKKGKYKGFAYEILHNDIGYRCGYIKVAWGHPWYREPYDLIYCHCHGGLTFSEEDQIAGWWVGFDCAHSGDAVDFDLPGEHRLLKGVLKQNDYRTIKTTEYVEKECIFLIEQAIAL